MLAALHRLNRHPRMQGDRCENGDGVQFRVLEKFLKTLVARIAAVDLLERAQAVRTDIAHGSDFRIRVKMPLKTAAEPATHHADFHLSRRAPFADTRLSRRIIE